MKLSACLVIRNEEKTLKKCLDSLKSVVDEIIIVHDGLCSDKSLALARLLGAKIFIRNFIGEAEYHRPFAYQKALGDWIIQIDADEFINEKLMKVIPKLIKSNACDAYSFSWPYPDKNGFIIRGPFAKTIKPTLFRKSLMFMIGISHEYPRTYGKLCLRHDLTIEHHPLYDNHTWGVFKNKWKKWAKLQAKQLKNLDFMPSYNISNKNNHHLFLQLRKIYRQPILTGLIETFKFIIIFFWRGLLTAGTRSWKIALFEISYIWMVRFYLLKTKYS